MSRSNIKTGWWKVTFDLTLEGEEVRFDDLSEVTQDHILDCLRDGYEQGEIIEEDSECVECVHDGEDICNQCVDHALKANACDVCGIHSEQGCFGCLAKVH